MKKRMHLSHIPVSLIFGVLALLMLFGMFYAPFLRHGEERAEPKVHAVEDYEKWGVSVSGCEELYFAESDHSAFGEGYRYSVLSGAAGISEMQYNRDGKKLTKTTGSGSDYNAAGFLSDVWMALEVPDEERCTLSTCSWTCLCTENGSQILIAESETGDTVYIAEQLL